jgi:hypothetical protein
VAASRFNSPRQLSKRIETYPVLPVNPVQRQLLSSFGFIKYERAYYCGVCRQGCLPLDEQLELSGRAVTPRLQRVIGSDGLSDEESLCDGLRSLRAGTIGDLR